jgi:hypothetical protein
LVCSSTGYARGICGSWHPLKSLTRVRAAARARPGLPPAEGFRL